MDPKYLPFGVGQAAAAAGVRPTTVSEAPIGGSASIEELLAKYGRAVGVPMVPEPNQEPQTGPEYIGRGVGEAIGMLIPGYGLARMAAPTARSVLSRIGGEQTAVTIPAAPASLPSRIAGQVADAPVRAPLSTIAGEMASGAGAGAGRYMVEQAYPGSEVAGTYGCICCNSSRSCNNLPTCYKRAKWRLRKGMKAKHLVLLVLFKVWTYHPRDY